MGANQSARTLRMFLLKNTIWGLFFLSWLRTAGRKKIFITAGLEAWLSLQSSCYKDKKWLKEPIFKNRAIKKFTSAAFFICEIKRGMKSSQLLILSLFLRLRSARSSCSRAGIISRSSSKSSRLCWCWSESLWLWISAFFWLIFLTPPPWILSSPEPQKPSSFSVHESDVGISFFLPLDRRFVSNVESESLSLLLALGFWISLYDEGAFEWLEPDRKPNKEIWSKKYHL